MKSSQTSFDNADCGEYQLKLVSEKLCMQFGESAQVNIATPC